MTYANKAEGAFIIICKIANGGTPWLSGPSVLTGALYFQNVRFHGVLVNVIRLTPILKVLDFPNSMQLTNAPQHYVRISYRIRISQIQLHLRPYVTNKLHVSRSKTEFCRSCPNNKIVWQSCSTFDCRIWGYPQVKGKFLGNPVACISLPHSAIPRSPELVPLKRPLLLVFPHSAHQRHLN